MTPPVGWPTPAALFKTILCDCLLTLHDRGAVNEDALLGVFKDLLDHKPLTVDHLSAAFGPEAIYEALRQAGFAGVTERRTPFGLREGQRVRIHIFGDAGTFDGAGTLTARKVRACGWWVTLDEVPPAWLRRFPLEDACATSTCS
jgi:hypothetical protein